MATAFLGLANAKPDVLAGMGAAGREYVAREHNVERLAGVFASAVDNALSRDQQP